MLIPDLCLMIIDKLGWFDARWLTNVQLEEWAANTNIITFILNQGARKKNEKRHYKNNGFEEEDSLDKVNYWIPSERHSAI